MRAAVHPRRWSLAKFLRKFFQMDGVFVRFHASKLRKWILYKERVFFHWVRLRATFVPISWSRIDDGGTQMDRMCSFLQHSTSGHHQSSCARRYRATSSGSDRLPIKPSRATKWMSELLTGLPANACPQRARIIHCAIVLAAGAAALGFPLHCGTSIAGVISAPPGLDTLAHVREETEALAIASAQLRAKQGTATPHLHLCSDLTWSPGRPAAPQRAASHETHRIHRPGHHRTRAVSTTEVLDGSIHSSRSRLTKRGALMRTGGGSTRRARTVGGRVRR